MPLGETVVALGTPSGESAIGVIRLSGPDCRVLIKDTMRRKIVPRPRTATLNSYYSLDGRVLDHVLYIYYEAPASYTGEDMLEINCHGSPLILQKILEDLLARGCRHALPGEFTRTAYLNEKLDLSQAEAVAGIISAKSGLALRAAQRQLRGGLAEKISHFVGNLLQAIAELEVFVDFPEDDLPEESWSSMKNHLLTVNKELEELIETSHYKSLLSDGVKTLILGAPNAGKSSLLNTLLGEERAIVSAQPGTTRDFISEEIMVGDYCIKIIDTAGIHDPDSDIEQEAINKALKKSHEADLFLLVLDQSIPEPIFPDEITSQLSFENTVVVRNKSDLPRFIDTESFLNSYSDVSISLKDKLGLSCLRNEILNKLSLRNFDLSEDTLVINARHSGALRNTCLCLKKCIQIVDDGGGLELGLSELREGVDQLGEVVGKIDNELILDKVFSTFCIGK